MDEQSCLIKYQNLSLQDFSSNLDVDPDLGLSREEAKVRRELYGTNHITPPHHCPSFLCCLFSCLARSSSMVAYHKAIPDVATVKRNGGDHPSFIRMDSVGIVHGDVVSVRAPQRVPADLRVTQCSDDCIVDQAALISEFSQWEVDFSDSEDTDALRGTRKKVFVECTDKNVLKACNMLLMGTQIVKGSAIGVVIAIGDDTTLGQMIAMNQWPVSSSQCLETEEKRGI